MRHYLIAAILATTAGAGVAFATQTAPMPGQHHGRHHGGMMTRIDANKDGIVTRDEAMAAAAKRFDQMDANHDSRIDKTEMAEMRQQHQQKRAEWHAQRMAQPQADGRTPPPAAGK